MNKCSYDTEYGTLQLSTGQPSTHFDFLADDVCVSVELNGDDRRVIGVIIQDGEPYLTLQNGYNASADTLTIGRTVDDPAFTSENDDFVAYWQLDEGDTDGALEPVGVALRNASKHLGKVRVLGSHPLPKGFQ